MGLRVRTNVESLAAQRSLSSNQLDQSNSMEKLASGSRINKSADDAAGLAISESLRGKTRGLTQAKRNANDGISMVQVAESSLNEMTNIMVRLRELTVQSASDTIGTTERSYLQKEYGEMVNEIDRISSTTEFNGRNLLRGDVVENGILVQVGYNSGEENLLKLNLSDTQGGLSSENLGLKDTSIAGDDRTRIAQNLDIIDKSLQTVANTRATLGATQSRLSSAVTSISISTENLMSANSRIRDVDFAEETGRLTQARILSQAGISVLSQANQKPELALALLR